MTSFTVDLPIFSSIFTLKSYESVFTVFSYVINLE